MYETDVKRVCRAIERKIRFKPAYFFCQHPLDRAPLRILVNRFRYWERGILRQELQSRGFVVKFWRAV